MRIYNARLGHACNSSSTHSIVPLATQSQAFSHDDFSPGEFGWDSFQLVSPGAKMLYLAALIGGRVHSSKVTEITGVTPYGPVGEYENGFGYVDHQSHFNLPYGSPHFDEFIQDFVAYLKRDDVVILGGNDNGGRPTISHVPWHHIWGPTKFRPGTAPDGSRYWTVFNCRDGDRLRFSFDKPETMGRHSYGDEEENKYLVEEAREYGLEPVYAQPLDLPYGDVPELVDMKLTDYCPFDCPWCYMGSTRAGAHAAHEDVLAWVDAFGKSEVFEIALGGGEPTLYPGLNDVFERATSYGMNVNLTTKNLKWVERDMAVSGVRAVAVSINYRKDLERLAKIDLNAARGKYPQKELTIQCVPAFCDDALLRDMVAFAREKYLRVTFLGVKRVGRAAEEKRPDDLRWLDVVKQHALESRYWGSRSIAVDTLMAKAAEDEFKALGINPVWYETDEGKFSCYVDATTNRLAVSSYVDDHKFISVLPGAFTAAFKAAQMVSGVRPR